MRLSIKKEKEPVRRPANCLNCSAAISTESIFCGQCGQENEPSPVSFAALVGEAWEEFIKIDGKLLATLGLLLFRPGHLTREYVRGRRCAYLSPFKMYIGVSALFFLVFGLIVPFDRLDTLDEKVAKLEQKVKDDQKKEEQIKKKQITKEPKQDKPDSKTTSVAAEDADEKTKTTINIGTLPQTNSNFVVGFVGDPPKSKKSKPFAVGFFGNSPPSPSSPPPFLKSEEKKEKRDKLLEGWTQFRKGHFALGKTRIALDKLPATVSDYRDAEEEKPKEKRDRAFFHYLKERIIKFRNDPGDTARNLFSTGLPFLLLLQLPLFAIWMRLIYFRQRRLYVEHLVFLLHTHTFFFLLFGLVLIADYVAQTIGTHLPMLDLPVTWLLLGGIVTIYNAIAYRQFYGQGWGKTLLKSWFLLNGYLFLLCFTVGISIAFAVIWTVFAPA